MSDSAQPATAAEPADFLHRAIRIVATIVLAYAGLQLAQYVVALFTDGAWWGYFVGSYRWIDRAIQLSRFGVIALLLAGAIGMLRWRPWSRPAVMLGMLLLVLVSFATYVLHLVKYAQDLSTAPTQPANAPVWRMALGYIFWFAESTIFPLLVWLILRQPQVARLFEHARSGGFEVVPFAQSVMPMDNASGPSNG